MESTIKYADIQLDDLLTGDELLLGKDKQQSPANIKLSDAIDFVYDDINKKINNLIVMVTSQLQTGTDDENTIYVQD